MLSLFKSCMSGGSWGFWKKVLVSSRSPWCQGPRAQGRDEAQVVLEEQRVGEEENQPWRD